MNIFHTLKTDDEYFTRYEAWADVAPYLPKTMVVWEAFYSPHSRSPTYLRELGFEVLSEPIDFFENNLGDCRTRLLILLFYLCDVSSSHL